METHSIAAIAAALTRAFESGRVCPLVGRGARDRALKLADLAEGGHLPPHIALQLAREVSELALCFAPLPQGDTP